VPQPETSTAKAAPCSNHPATKAADGKRATSWPRNVATP
jgi:hypothetical protein